MESVIKLFWGVKGVFTFYLPQNGLFAVARFDLCADLIENALFVFYPQTGLLHQIPVVAVNSK